MGDLIQLRPSAQNNSELLERANNIGALLKSKIDRANDLVLKADIVGGGLVYELDFWKRRRLKKIRNRKLKEVDQLIEEINALQVQGNVLIEKLSK